MTSQEARRHPAVKIAAELHRYVLASMLDLGGNWRDQLLRSLVSVGANWCEGHGKRDGGSPAMYPLRISRGEAYESAFLISLLGDANRDLLDLADRMCDLLDTELPDEFETKTSSSTLTITAER